MQYLPQRQEVVKLDQLKTLILRNTHLTDAGFKELAKLEKLTKLNLQYTKVTKAGVAELQKAMPKCKIFHYAKK